MVDEEPLVEVGSSQSVLTQALSKKDLLHKTSMRRVTSHAKFQLELTDDEEDMSHSSRPDEEQETDLKLRRAVTRGESSSSVGGVSRHASAGEKASFGRHDSVHSVGDGSSR